MVRISCKKIYVYIFQQSVTVKVLIAVIRMKREIRINLTQFNSVEQKRAPRNPRNTYMQRHAHICLPVILELRLWMQGIGQSKKNFCEAWLLITSSAVFSGR